MACGFWPERLRVRMSSAAPGSARALCASMLAEDEDCDARWSCVAAMLGGSREGTLKPGAPMVKGSKDSADESESVMNLDSSELKREDEAGGAPDDEEAPRECPFAVGVSEAEEPESDDADGGWGMANDMNVELG